MRTSVGTFIGTSMLLAASLVAGPVSAQTQTPDLTGPHNPYCGAWVDGTWTPNGACVAETTTTVTTTTTQPAAATATLADVRVPQRVMGTITAVKGHLVTLQQSTRSLVVDDSRALEHQDTGRVAVGRAIVAHGYWLNGTFFASRFDTASTQ